MVREEPARPFWTMDIMVLAEVNEISKLIDEYAMQVESGATSSIIQWKACLRQLYRNISSFFPQTINQVTERAFQQLDELIDPVKGIMPSTEAQLKMSIQLLAFLNEIFYQMRNAIFMRIIKEINPIVKATTYAFDALPDEEKRKKIREAELKAGIESES